MPLNNAYHHNLNISENSPTKTEKKFRKTSTIALLIIVHIGGGLLPAHIMISLKFYWNIAKTRLFQQTSGTLATRRPVHRPRVVCFEDSVSAPLAKVLQPLNFATFLRLQGDLGELQTWELEKFQRFCLETTFETTLQKKVTSLWGTLAHNHNIPPTPSPRRSTWVGGRISVTFYVSPKGNLKLPTSRFLLLNPVTQCRFNEVIFNSLPCFFSVLGDGKLKKSFALLVLSGQKMPVVFCGVLSCPVSRWSLRKVDLGQRHTAVYNVFLSFWLFPSRRKKLGNNIFLYLKKLS